MFRDILLLLLTFFLALSPSSSARSPPFVMRISCGAQENIRTVPTNTFWFKDFAYTGGIPATATSPRYIAPPLKTLRYFPRSEGLENCYHLNKIPKGHYSVRIFFGLVAEPNFDNEPLFDTSVEGTQICSLESGWTSHDEQVFAEALVFLSDRSASICFHSTGVGDPGILSIEILQVDNQAYYFGPQWAQGTIFRTVRRLSCGAEKLKFDVDDSGNNWGGNRFWEPIKTFGQSDHVLSVNDSIKQASVAPNFYPESLYKTALVSTDNKPDLEYTMDVDPNRNYSVWLHFAEIDKSVSGAGQRIFDILINDEAKFRDIDIVKMSGDLHTALVLNTTVAVDGMTLTIIVHPRKGSHAIINALEVFEVVIAESKTLHNEVKALQKLKTALKLPPRLGWNGDPCVPQEHPWTGVNCQFDRISSKWVIAGLGLNNQGLSGFLPDDMSKFVHLQSINLSGNSIHGPIPSSLGTITSLKILDLSYNFFNGSIPENLGQLASLQKLNLNGNALSGKVPAAFGGSLWDRANFNVTDNAGLCGISGLPTCRRRLSTGSQIGLIIVAFLLIAAGVYWLCKKYPINNWLRNKMQKVIGVQKNEETQKCL